MTPLGLFFTVFNSVAALLALGALGYWAISRGGLEEAALGSITHIAIDIAVPALLFVSIMDHFSPRGGWWQVLVAGLAFTLYALLLALLFSPLAARATRREFLVSLAFQNAIFFPIVVIGALYGTASPYLADLFIFTLFFAPIVYNSVGLFFRGEGHARAQIRWSLLFNPILVATLLALTLRFLRLEVSSLGFLYTAFQMLAGLSLPLLMLLLGGHIYLNIRHEQGFNWRENLKFVLVKGLAFPLITLGLLLWLRPAYNIALLVLLQSTLPPITAIPSLVRRSGGDDALAAQFITSSFITSLLTIPLMLALFGMLFPAP